MSQRAVLGLHTRRPIAVVREHGSRVELIALERWVAELALEHTQEYWLGNFAPHSTPESSMLESFS